MKKIFLTLVAVGFGVSVSFAQTTETEVEAQPQDAQLEQTQPADNMYQDEQARTEVDMASLPSAVQDAFKTGQYSEMEVLGIYEASEAGAEGTVYEFELAQKSEEGVEAPEMEGVETETVSERQPDLTILIDENGQVIEEKQAEEVE